MGRVERAVSAGQGWLVGCMSVLLGTILLGFYGVIYLLRIPYSIFHDPFLFSLPYFLLCIPYRLGCPS